MLLDELLLVLLFNKCIAEMIGKWVSVYLPAWQQQQATIQCQQMDPAQNHLVELVLG